MMTMMTPAAAVSHDMHNQTNKDMQQQNFLKRAHAIFIPLGTVAVNSLQSPHPYTGRLVSISKYRQQACTVQGYINSKDIKHLQQMLKTALSFATNIASSRNTGAQCRRLHKVCPE
jgi:hypothetical protein